jgi:hypothetical protein
MHTVMGESGRFNVVSDWRHDRKDMAVVLMLFEAIMGRTCKVEYVEWFVWYLILYCLCNYLVSFFKEVIIANASVGWVSI